MGMMGISGGPESILALFQNNSEGSTSSKRSKRRTVTMNLINRPPAWMVYGRGERGDGEGDDVDVTANSARACHPTANLNELT